MINAKAPLKWGDAKSKIQEKSEQIIKDYSETCPTITNNYKAVISKDFDEAWDMVKKSLSTIEELDIYKKAIENPTDNILWQELSMQASGTVGAQVVGTMVKNDFSKARQLGMKVGGIISLYLELLREELKK